MHSVTVNNVCYLTNCSVLSYKALHGKFLANPSPLKA
jgi:hypothetical protein